MWLRKFIVYASFVLEGLFLLLEFWKMESEQFCDYKAQCVLCEIVVELSFLVKVSAEVHWPTTPLVYLSFGV